MDRVSFPPRQEFGYHNSPICIMLLVEFEATPYHMRVVKRLLDPLGWGHVRNSTNYWIQ
jgi:hypothetical protein